MPPWLLFLLTLVIGIYIAVAAHEFGLAIAAWRNGFIVGAAGIGCGRPIISLKAFGTRFFLGSKQLRSRAGITLLVHRRLFPTHKEIAALFLGGAIANAILCVIAIAAIVRFSSYHFYFIILLTVNLVIPLQYWDDRPRICTLPILSHRKKIQQAAKLASAFDFHIEDLLSMDSSMAALLNAVHLPTFLYVYRMNLAVRHLELSQVELAEENRRLAVGALPEATSEMKAIALMMDAACDSATGERAMALDKITEASALFRSDGKDRAVHRAQLIRAAYLLDLERMEEARALVANLENNAFNDELPNASEELKVLRLRFAVYNADMKLIADSLADLPDSAVPTSVYFEIAALFVSTGRKEGALGYLDLIRSDVENMYLGCIYPDRKSAFLEAKMPLLQSLADHYTAVGQPKTLQYISGHFYSLEQRIQEEAEQRKEEGKQKRRSAKPARSNRWAYAFAGAFYLASILVGLPAYLETRQQIERARITEALGVAGIISLLLVIGNLILYPIWRLTLPDTDIGGWFALGSCIVPLLFFLSFLLLR